MFHEDLRLRLSNREYTNWIKAGQCLCLLAEGLQPFIDREMRDFHAHLLRENERLRRPCDSHCKSSGNKLLGACRFCSEWQMTIHKHHRQPQNAINWDNCSPASWRTDHWEVAKAFMPRGQGKVREAGQFDPSALLNVISCCDWFHSDPKPVREVIRCRNELMHSSNLLVSDNWLKHYESKLRNCTQQFKSVASIVTAEKRIKQMLRTDLSVHIHGSDQTDLDDLVTDCVHDEISANSIVQWEAELLQQRLQELLEETDETNALSAEELKDLGSFFEANKDLGERFSSLLQNMNLFSKSSRFMLYLPTSIHLINQESNKYVALDIDLSDTFGELIVTVKVRALWTRDIPHHPTRLRAVSGFAMSAKATMRRHKTYIHRILSGDHKLVLNKVHQHSLITDREYNNLKGIYKEHVEGHIVELVDTIMDKGEERCERFLSLLETDDEIKDTFPSLKTIQLSCRRHLTEAIQESFMDNKDDDAPRTKKTKMDEPYPVNSYPTGICLILNNMNFEDGAVRRGTDKDAESLAEVFNWLGFKVLMCEDLTKIEMSSTLQCFSTLSGISELQRFSLKEWTTVGFVDLQQTPKHGDVFVCCVLTHGNKGVVYGTDKSPLAIKDITRTFKATSISPLTAKPKVFFIQACQGAGNVQSGVIEADLETDGGPSVSVPEEADVLVAVATVEDYVSFRHKVNGSWFIQTLCQQLKEGCSRGVDIHSILQQVNSEVSQKEGKPDKPGEIKQMPAVHYTLTRKLMLSPYHS
ncbi:uncharacterized protein [Eucyclogobius newberryi]|uniref:uncharacterized protein n=1 Tax=Eucyclogobius newberryi TaxID=166745 RepID=UPI003B5B71A3